MLTPSVLKQPGFSQYSITEYLPSFVNSKVLMVLESSGFFVREGSGTGTWYGELACWDLFESTLRESHSLLHTTPVCLAFH